MLKLRITGDSDEISKAANVLIRSKVPFAYNGDDGHVILTEKDEFTPGSSIKNLLEMWYDVEVEELPQPKINPDVELLFVPDFLVKHLRDQGWTLLTDGVKMQSWSAPVKEGVLFLHIDYRPSEDHHCTVYMNALNTDPIIEFPISKLVYQLAEINRNQV